LLCTALYQFAREKDEVVLAVLRGTGRYGMVPGGTNGRVGAGSIEPWSLEGQNVKSVKTWTVSVGRTEGGAFMVSTGVNHRQPVSTGVGNE